MPTSPELESRVVHVRHDPYDVYIGRAMPRQGFAGSKWGNPFRIGRDGDRAEVLAKYETYLRSRPELMAALPELAGKVLGCWCKVPGFEEPCHGDVLVRLAAPRIVSTPGTCAGDPRFDGTRLPVVTIIQAARWLGEDEEKIRTEFSTLPVGGLAVALAYYRDHPDEVNRLIAEVSSDDPADEAKLTGALGGVAWVARRHVELQAEGFSIADLFAWIEAEAAQAIGDPHRLLTAPNPHVRAELQRRYAACG